MEDEEKSEIFARREHEAKVTSAYSGSDHWSGGIRRLAHIIIIRQSQEVLNNTNGFDAGFKLDYLRQW